MTIKLTGQVPGEAPTTVEFMTVGELIDLLKDLDPAMPIGRQGHFGELHAMDKYNFWVATCERVERFWKGAECEPFQALTIGAPDIGPEPD